MKTISLSLDVPDSQNTEKRGSGLRVESQQRLVTLLPGGYLAFRIYEITYGIHKLTGDKNPGLDYKLHIFNHITRNRSTNS